MVHEREPPKPSTREPSSQSSSGKPIEFGQPSSLNQKISPHHIFNVPKPNRPRPEHHRPAPYTSSHANPPFRPPHPLQPRVDDSNADVVEIPRSKFTAVNTQPSFSQRPATYSAWNPGGNLPTANGVFVTNPNAHIVAAPPLPSRGLIDLTSSPIEYRPPPPLHDDTFALTDPGTYIDAEEANKNIKALFEGSIEDETDKPKKRGRKKQVEATVDGLADEVHDLKVKAEQTALEQDSKDTEHKEDEEEEEDDDGTFEGLKVKLLPHQVEGVDWMHGREISGRKKHGILPKGGILADDMGLGKTIQSIALMLSNPRPPVTSATITTDKKSLPASVGKGTLVVAPLALIRQWEAEIKDKVASSHSFRVCVHHGPGRTKRFEDLKKYDIVITTYQILVSEHGSSSPREDGPQAGCFGLHWYRVILDEAHTIKNRNAKATKAAGALRSEYRWCLTGTPMQNNLDELQSLIKFLRIKPYDDLSTWREQITRPMSQGKGGLAIKRLRAILKTFMKRRTKDVLKKEGALVPGGQTSNNSASKGFQITARNIESIVADFDPGEWKFYKGLEQRADKSLARMMDDNKLNYASALVLLLRLRQACNHPDLVGGSMANDKDALTTGSQSPRKGKPADNVDDLTNMLGVMSVETRQCDVCMIDLSEEEASTGLNRCAECQQSLLDQKIQRKKKDSKVRRAGSSLIKAESQRLSDDEGEGDWLVSRDRRKVSELGVAGGTDDENAEGEGLSLGMNDTTSRDEDSDILVTGARRRLAASRLDADQKSDADSTAESSSDLDSDTDSSQDPPPVISAKIRHLLAILDREAPKRKIIVFSQFTSMLNLLEPHLRSHKLCYTRYDGSMRNDAREASLERLRKDPRTRVLLCSLKCGSLGLNLTAASCVVIIEPFWNPFVEEQAIDRVHRLNQTKDVTVYKMTVKDTVEARILELQEKKRKLAEAAIEGKEKAGKLTLQDLLKLFGQDAEREHKVGDDGLGNHPGVLRPSEGSGMGATGIMETRGRRHVTPPTIAKGDRTNSRKEHEVFGRRW